MLCSVVNISSNKKRNILSPFYLFYYKKTYKINKIVNSFVMYCIAKRHAFQVHAIGVHIENMNISSFVLSFNKKNCSQQLYARTHLKSVCILLYINNMLLIHNYILCRTVLWSDNVFTKCSQSTLSELPASYNENIQMLTTLIHFSECRQLAWI